jgi:hypothetical protein
MHLKEEGREGKEKREGRKLPFKKCNEVEEGRTNKVQRRAYFPDKRNQQQDSERR